MSEHTKEPWHFGKYNPQCVMGSDNKLVVGDFYEDREKSAANARRIVACVNACASFTTHQLEKHSYKDSVVSEITKRIEAEKQSEKLLAVLKSTRKALTDANDREAIVDTIWKSPFETLFDFIDAAIAEAEANHE